MKTVVLINCVCKAQFTKTTIKQHLLQCNVWRLVKMKKNLVSGAKEEPLEEVYEESYEQEVATDPNALLKEDETEPTSSDEMKEDFEKVKVIEVVPQVAYNCECGVNFRHLNVFKVHQSSCALHLRSLGHSGESALPQRPARMMKEDIVLKYDKPKGEILQNCACGFKIASIFALRQHQSSCPAGSIRKSQQKPPAKRLLVAPDDAKAGSSKMIKVDLREELKDLVRIDRMRKKK